jgi:hypothetical protein
MNEGPNSTINEASEDSSPLMVSGGNQTETEQPVMREMGAGPEDPVPTSKSSEDESLTPQMLYISQLSPKSQQKFNLIFQKNIKTRSALITLGNPKMPYIS